MRYKKKRAFFSHPITILINYFSNNNNVEISSSFPSNWPFERTGRVETRREHWKSGKAVKKTGSNGGWKINTERTRLMEKEYPPELGKKKNHFSRFARLLSATLTRFTRPSLFLPLPFPGVTRRPTQDGIAAYLMGL